jgi:hypothetical protein
MRLKYVLGWDLADEFDHYKERFYNFDPQLEVTVSNTVRAKAKNFVDYYTAKFILDCGLDPDLEADFNERLYRYLSYQESHGLDENEPIQEQVFDYLVYLILEFYFEETFTHLQGFIQAKKHHYLRNISQKYQRSYERELANFDLLICFESIKAWDIRRDNLYSLLSANTKYIILRHYSLSFATRPIDQLIDDIDLAHLTTTISDFHLLGDTEREDQLIGVLIETLNDPLDLQIINHYIYQDLSIRETAKQLKINPSFVYRRYRKIITDFQELVMSWSTNE